MSNFFYSKLAISNIKKNGKTYFPYIITCICSIMMFYIMNSISKNEGLSKIPGCDQLGMILSLGVSVIGIFSAIFLFYTNSFLIKRRKKELGLYNVLGLEKKHIAKVLILETIFISFISFILGLIGAIIFDKLMFIFLLKLIDFKVPLGFYISKVALVRTLIVFIGIFSMMLLANLFQIKRTNPIELLKGGQHGEKEPKTKWVMTLIGIVALGAGYGIALNVEKPLSALNLFFTAVILVMVGTYAIFTAGSIVILKLLRKNKKFYYKTKNFVSVSGMMYRMKQNAVGLANICILSTAVLVMVSTTVCLYVGVEDALKNRYPKEVLIETSQINKEQCEKLNNIVEEEIKDSNIVTKNMVNYLQYNIPCAKKGNNFSIAKEDVSLTEICFINAILLSDYNRLEDENITLSDDEVLIFSKDDKYGSDVITINEKRFRVKKEIDSLNNVISNFTDIVKSYVVILNDVNKLGEFDEDENIKKYMIGFDIEGNDEKMIEISSNLNEKFYKNNMSVSIENLEANRKNFSSIYGGLFFLGIFLGTLFLMATVLIIYYKQVSEGYDDKERFEIMQKVGMSKMEVKKTIRSQILMVFFLPLVFAIVHIAFAFPIITKLLEVLMLTNVKLFIIATIGTILIFAVIYAIVFTLTARTYYKIVE